MRFKHNSGYSDLDNLGKESSFFNNNVDRDVSECIKMRAREAASDESSDEINIQAERKKRPAAIDDRRGRN